MKRPGQPPGFACQCALVLLCAALVGWAIQAKLSLYSSMRSAVTISRLSTENGSPRTMGAIRSAMELPSTSPEILLLAARLPAVSFCCLQAQRLTPRVLRSRRREPVGLDLMRRPPPAIA